MAADEAQKITAEIEELECRIAELKSALQKLPDKDFPGKAAAAPPEEEPTIFRSLHDDETQKSLLVAVLETIDVGVSLCDQNGVFLICNSESRRIGGVPVMDREENRAAPYGAFYPDEVTTYPTEILPLVRALQGETVRDEPMFLRNARQTRGIHLSISAIPFIDSSGKPAGAVLVVRDITELKQSEQQHARRAEALAIVQREAEAQKNLLEAVLESIDIGVTVSDKQGDFVIFNPAARRMLGVGPVSGVENWTPEYGCFRIDGTLYPAEELPLSRALRGETVQEDKLYICNPETADDVLLSVSASPFINPPGYFEGAVCFFRDITAETVARDAVEHSESRFRAFMDNVPAIAFIKTSRGQYVYGNRHFFDYHPTTPEDLENSPVTDFDLTSPETAAMLQENDRRVLEEQTPLHVGELLISTKGPPVWFLVYKFFLPKASGESYVGGIAIDVTERREHEQRLIAEDQLLRKMIDFQEAERQLISHDIHDGAVQDVVGAKMLLEALTSHLSPAPDSHTTEQFQAIGTALTRAIIDLRRLISELRPLVMDEEGIIEAIRFLISESQHARDLKITFTHKTSGDRYHPMLEGNLFRIVGEALTNAHRHSDAAAVCIHLEEREEMLYLTVQDNGIGFQETEIDASRFGLHGIRERARLFGGKANISSQIGKGTTIKVAIPVAMPTE